MPTPPPPPPKPKAAPKPPSGRPQGTGTSGTSGTPRASAPTRTPPLQKKLEEFLSVPAMVYSAAGHDYPAQIIALRSPDLAQSLYELSKENAAIKRNLERLMEGGAWGGVILASASILVPVLSYHGLLPSRVGDPFALISPTPSASPDRDGARGPIVPPPPGSPSPTVNGGGRDASSEPGYTPPLRDDQPPGTVTVAGTNANAVGQV